MMIRLRNILTHYLRVTVLITWLFTVPLWPFSQYPGDQVWAACIPGNTGTAGDDTITCTGANSAGSSNDVDAGGGNDTINFNGGTARNVMGGAGVDRININGGTITASPTGADGTIDAGDGDDIVTLNGGTVEGQIRGGSGNNKFFLYGGSVIKGVGVFGGVGNDEIILDGASVGTNIIGGGGVDTIKLINGTIGSGTGVFKGVSWGAGDESDTLDLTNVDFTGDLLFGDGEDNFILNGGTVKEGTVALGESYNSNAYSDIFTMNGGTIEGRTVGSIEASILGDMGSDTINLNGGQVNKNILGGDGDDIINLNGTTVASNIDGEGGNDTLTWTAGTLGGSLLGGDGSDTATVSAASYNGSQVLDGGDNYGTADGMIDSLTLQGLNLNLPGANLTNWENITVDGGTISFSDNALRVGSDANTGLTLRNGAVLNSGGQFTLTGNMMNNGTVTIRDGTIGGNVTITGDYSGGGTLEMDADLSAAQADLLVVTGDTAGRTMLRVNALGVGQSTDANGNGIRDKGEGIKMIDVGGISSPTAFWLERDVISNGYAYHLFHDDTTSGEWYLANAPFTVIPIAPVYESLYTGMQGLTRVRSLFERVGSRSCRDGFCALKGPGSLSDVSTVADGFWIDLDYANDNLQPKKSMTGFSVDRDTTTIEAGIDKVMRDNQQGRFTFGVSGHYGDISSDLTAVAGNGSIDTEGVGVGVTGTWCSVDELYADAQFRYTWFDNDISSATYGTLKDNVDGTGRVFSLEVGKRMPVILENKLTVTPQLQLWYSKLRFDGFTDSRNNNISGGDEDSLTTRGGMLVEYRQEAKEPTGMASNVYGKLNIYHVSDRNRSITVSDSQLRYKESEWLGEAGVGVALSWAGGKYSAYGEIDYTSDLESSNYAESVRGSVGLRVYW